MADQARDSDNTEAEKTQGKKVYRRPALTKLGNLRDMTLTLSNIGANDGMPSKGTKRGGNFETSDCGR